jgi:hypothetical protein
MRHSGLLLFLLFPHPSRYPRPYMCIRNAYVSVAVNVPGVTSRYRGTREYARFITVCEISKVTRNKPHQRDIYVKILAVLYLTIYKRYFRHVYCSRLKTEKWHFNLQIKRTQGQTTLVISLERASLYHRDQIFLVTTRQNTGDTLLVAQLVEALRYKP